MHTRGVEVAPGTIGPGTTGRWVVVGWSAADVARRWCRGKLVSSGCGGIYGGRRENGRHAIIKEVVCGF